MATFNKNERVDLSSEERKVLLTEEYFSDFHPVVTDDKNFLEKFELSKEVQISIGALGIMLIFFSLATLWSTYSSYRQRKSLHNSHIELILARRAT